MVRRIPVLLLIAAALALPLGVAAQGKPTERNSRPAWSELTPAQREALAPLASEWNGFDADRKQKWLEVAKKYPQLSPEGKARVQQRMGEYSRLTPQQRTTARENFRKAYELPLDQRQSAVQQYRGMGDAERKALAEKAKAKKSQPQNPQNPPQRRPTK
jgi:hypothetical protein